VWHGVAETQQNDAVRKVRRRRKIYLVANLITIPLFALVAFGTVQGAVENARLHSSGIRVTGVVDSVDRSGKGDAVGSRWWSPSRWRRWSAPRRSI
jgi:hypothetical protein